jgi:hypothetical protein
MACEAEFHLAKSFLRYYSGVPLTDPPGWEVALSPTSPILAEFVLLDSATDRHFE